MVNIQATNKRIQKESQLKFACKTVLVSFSIFMTDIDLFHILIPINMSRVKYRVRLLTIKVRTSYISGD